MRKILLISLVLIMSVFMFSCEEEAPEVPGGGHGGGAGKTTAPENCVVVYDYQYGGHYYTAIFFTSVADELNNEYRYTFHRKLWNGTEQKLPYYLLDGEQTGSTDDTSSNLAAGGPVVKKVSYGECNRAVFTSARPNNSTANLGVSAQVTGKIYSDITWSQNLLEEDI